MVTRVDEFDTAVQFREMYEPTSTKFALVVELFLVQSSRSALVSTSF